MKKQVFNPYLPSFEYIPDGEPHVFGDRIYLYGSHDRFDGDAFCLNDYVSWSASVTDLKHWRYEGVIYKKEQDPRNSRAMNVADYPADSDKEKSRKKGTLNAPGIHAMWAPDVVQGPDGRYYLYYCLDYLPEIAVAVGDSPIGPYEFYGLVHDGQGCNVGTRPQDVYGFDPGVYVDEDGEIYLYSGQAPWPLNPDRERKHSVVMKLHTDMLTLKTEPRNLIPDMYECAGTDFEGHAFFEASSIRKINGMYYFVYSSVNSHELCYAVSDRPDGSYHFGGTLVDIGDVYLDGRTADAALNPLGNTHGGIEVVNGEYYIFYHRQTHQTQFSRQACAEKLKLSADGHFEQVEVTSCGLNGAPLAGIGTYPASIACEISRNGKNVKCLHAIMQGHYPYVSQDEPDTEPTAESIERDTVNPYQHIANLQNGTRVSYKYFELNAPAQVELMLRGSFTGSVKVLANEKPIGHADVKLEADTWTAVEIPLCAAVGKCKLTFAFDGNGVLSFHTFTLENP